MLSIFAKRDKEELSQKLEDIEALKSDISKRDEVVKLLKEEIKKQKEELLEKDEKIKSLEWKLEEERENSQKLSQDLKYKKDFYELLELFGYENKNLINSLTNIQNSIADSTNKAKQSLKLSDDVDENFKESFENIKVIIASIDGLLQKSHIVSEVVDDLSKKAQNIEKFVGQINEVVMQINILSLNASVEAASAGDAGKGFAVVASEVKKLATKTAYVANDIEEVVKSIKESISNTNSEFKEIDKSINLIHDLSKQYDGKMNNLSNLTNNFIKELNHLADSTFVSLAKLDHVVWKINTYKSIHEKKPAFKFVNHKNCRLGKWYNEGEGLKHFSQTSSYRDLDKPHSIVHDTTHKVFELLESEDFEYKKVQEACDGMESASGEVFEILDKIFHERVDS